MTTLLHFLLLLLMLQWLGCVQSQPYPNYHADIVVINKHENNLKWWQTGAFYQIYPRSFKDSNSDGVGDLNGITEKLPYLKDLGISATWLSPIFTSPMADFGYDIANFTEIAPIFGDMSDFERLMKTAKQLNIKIILDFVPNHSSDECDWFKRSVAKEAEYKDFYVWHPGKMVDGKRHPPNNWVSVFRGSAWEWNEQRQEYYLHQFVKKQPDLNYRNPKVREAMKNVLRFWLNKGVAGFRIDAVPHVFEIAPDNAGQYRDEPHNSGNNDPDDYGYLNHIYTVDQPETINLVYEWRAVLDEFSGSNGDDRILLAETYSPIEIVMQYYGNETAEGAQLPFNFLLISEISNSSNALNYAQSINKWLNFMPKGRTANWVLGNHDQARVASRLGTDRVDMLNMLITTLPGASVTYQGEELGMTNVWISWKDTVDPSACNTNPSVYERFTRDPERTPFQWSSDTDAGFSNASKTWLPISQDYKLVNVDRERKEALSHLNIYKQLMELRRNEKTLQLGETKVMSFNDNVLGVQRLLKHDYIFVTVLNLFDTTETVNLKEGFEHLSFDMKVMAVSGKSQRKVGDYVSVKSLQLLPKESLVLKSTSTYYMYYFNGEHRQLPIEGVYLFLAQVVLYVLALIR